MAIKLYYVEREIQSKTDDKTRVVVTERRLVMTDSIEGLFWAIDDLNCPSQVRFTPHIIGQSYVSFDTKRTEYLGSDELDIEIIESHSNMNYDFSAPTAKWYQFNINSRGAVEPKAVKWDGKTGMLPDYDTREAIRITGLMNKDPLFR